MEFINEVKKFWKNFFRKDLYAGECNESNF